MAEWDARYWGSPEVRKDRDEVEAMMVAYMERVVAKGESWSHVSRHMLGLRNGLPGARRWRQVWSDYRLKHEAPVVVSRMARAASAAFAFEQSAV
jgi:tRNA-dihydrouridine synthase A